MTLYQTLDQAGLRIESHESDLHVERTTEAFKIIKSFPLHYKNCSTFIEILPNKMRKFWLDVPFAFDPFWEGKAR